MSANRFITLVNGIQTWMLSITTSNGTADANKIVSTGSNGRLHESLLPPGIGASTISLPASESLSAGDFVNIFDDAGTRKVRKADSSNARDANGFVLEAVASNASASVVLQGLNTSLSGLVVGGIYFLGTNGTISTNPPSTTGHIIQDMGVPVSTSSLNFEYNGHIVIA